MDYCEVSLNKSEIKVNHDRIDSYKEKKPDWDKIRQNYVGENPDWLEFVKGVSDRTVNGLEEEWQGNFDTNLRVVKNHGSAFQLVDSHGFNKIGVIVGAAPALQKNGHLLKGAKEKEGFLIVSTGSALKYLLSIGVRPQYVVVVDSSILVKKQIEGVDTKGITLIANAWCHPEVLDCWEGKKFFMYLPIKKNKDDDKINLEMLGDEQYVMSALGNVFNSAFQFAYCVLNCKTQIFVGNELCVNPEQYYADGTTPDSLSKTKLAYATTIRGKEAYTMPSFYQYKLVLENATANLPGFFINATEDGILGQTHRYGRLPWIHQFRLQDALRVSKQAYKSAKQKEKEHLALEVASGYTQSRKLQGLHGV